MPDETCHDRVADDLDPPATSPAAKFFEKIQHSCAAPAPTPAHDYFNSAHAMASESRPPDEQRPGAPSRTRTAVETLLSAGMMRRGASASRPPSTPHMERSKSSMADSFVDYYGVCKRAQDAEPGVSTPDPNANKDDSLTPISNWAHLNYIKTQRNHLRNELKAHQIAGAEAKKSVASLRRLALRMAVNISVKEKQIAASARNLAKSRKSAYIGEKDAEKRVAELKRSLRIEEGRNKDILEALERASMLTLQYANPPETQQRGSWSLSPPPSPPQRLSNLPMTAITGPRTPPRSTSSSWHDWELTPGLESPTEIRTSDSRLIRAKRESDQALSACRRRINELQAECTRSREDGEILEESKTNLEKEIEEQRSRITLLQHARTAVEETLESTRLQLEVSTDLEGTLKQKLRAKNKELASLQQGGEEKQQEVDALQEEKDGLTKQLEDRNTQLADFETRTVTLEQNLKEFQEKLDKAQTTESSLHDQLKEKEQAIEELKLRLDRGSKYEQILQKKIAEHEQEILGNVRKIDVGSGLISSLREQIKQSDSNKADTEKALSNLREELGNLKFDQGLQVEQRDRLFVDLNEVQSVKRGVENELQATKNALEEEKTQKGRLESELKTLHSSIDTLRADLQAARKHIQSLERIDAESQADFEVLQDEKAAIEADLKDARQSLFSLREAERMKNAELSELKSTVRSFEHQLKASKERESILEDHVKEARAAQFTADQQREEDSQKLQEQHRELQLSVASLQTTLEASEKLKDSLQEELRELQSSDDKLDKQLKDTIRLKTDLLTEFDAVKLNLEHVTSESTGLKTKVTELEAELSASRQSEAEIEIRLGTVDSERQKLEKVVSELELALNDSRDAQSKTEESLRAAQTDREASGAELLQLQTRIEETQGSKDEVENRFQDAITKTAEVETQLHSAQAKLAEVESEASQTRSQLSTLREEMAEAQRSKSDLEDRLQTSQQAHDELKNQLQLTASRLQAAEAEVATLTSKLAEREDELERIRQEKAGVESKLEDAQKSHAEIEEQLSTARQDQAKMQALENDLVSVRLQLTDARETGESITSKLKDADAELNTLRQGKIDLEGKLDEAAVTSKELDEARSRLSDFESQHKSLNSRISAADEELAAIREQKSKGEQQSGKLQEDLSAARSLLQALESEKSSLDVEARKIKQEMTNLRDTNSKLEEEIGAATQRTAGVENDLRAARMRLDIAEIEGHGMRSRVIEADKDISTLREANTKLAESEKHLLDRVASAEEELQEVQETNSRLEAFLERVEKDMTHAEVAFEESEKRLEEFVDESQAKLDAARNAKLKYKRKLSAKSHEVELLMSENSKLHHVVDEQTQELSTLTKGNEELTERLSEKEKFVSELKSSSDGRMKSMNHAYNELRAKYEKHIRKHNDGSASRSQGDSKEKGGKPDGSSNESEDPQLAALRQEVEALREDKKTFERLVATLQEKIRHSETLEEWGLEPVPDSVPSSPSTQHSRSSRPGSILSGPTSIGRLSVLQDRPTTRASASSRHEDLDSWAKDVERIRMLRDEQAVQLRDNKKARSDLRKSLKESKSQLHQLEKHSKPTRPRAYLRKSRPSTPLPFSSESDQLSPLPFASDTARSRHTIHFSPSTPGIVDRPNTSTPLSATRRWSTLHRPKSSHRPVTSGGLEDIEHERPTTSAGEGGMHAPKPKRRWSVSLRKLFKQEA